MINTSASGNVTVTFTKEEWERITHLVTLKTSPESCALSASAEYFKPENSFRHKHSAYVGGVQDGHILLARQIVG